MESLDLESMLTEELTGWHGAGFRLYWRWKSRPRGGRPRSAAELRVLIRRMAKENTDWGAPKIHGELQKLGFVLSERTVARYLPRMRHRGDVGKKWLAFLHNHRDAIVAFDFFTVSTASFRILRRVLSEYVRYYQEDRVHDSLSKDMPIALAIEPRPTAGPSLTALPRSAVSTLDSHSDMLHRTRVTNPLGAYRRNEPVTGLL